MLARTLVIVAAITGLALHVSGCRKSQETQESAAPQSRPASLPTAATLPAEQAVSPDALDAPHLVSAQKMINDGVAYLLANREADGGWSLGQGRFKPAATAMALKVLVQHPDFGPQHPAVRQGFKVLLSFKQKDGGIYNPQEGVTNYTTALAVMALAISGDPQLRGDLNDALAYLRKLQIVPGSESPDGKVVPAESPAVGGVNYGKTGQPDLSNLSMWMEALKDAGVQSDDPSMQRAVAFLNRVQNRSESNPLKFAAQGSNDGGFVYSPVESKAGQGPNDMGLRSYGSMTYAGFKSMLYAGLAKNDPRVQAAYRWIQQYWRLDCNPNLPQAQNLQGLYYYYQLFAKALRAWGEPIIHDAQGQPHNWRQELIDALAARVNKDGSWKNQADRWQEGSPILVTAYAVTALQETLKK